MSLYNLPNVPYWQPAIGKLGAFVTGLDDIEQAIRIIVATPKGSLPHRPEFGCDLLAYLDSPQGAATPLIIREVTQALEAFEPRIVVSRVGVVLSSLGVSTLRISWYPKGTANADRSASTRTTEVTPGASDLLGLPSPLPRPASSVATAGSDEPIYIDGGLIP